MTSAAGSGTRCSIGQTIPEFGPVDGYSSPELGGGHFDVTVVQLSKKRPCARHEGWRFASAARWDDRLLARAARSSATIHWLAIARRSAIAGMLNTPPRAPSDALAKLKHASFDVPADGREKSGAVKPGRLKGLTRALLGAPRLTAQQVVAGRPREGAKVRQVLRVGGSRICR